MPGSRTRRGRGPSALTRIFSGRPSKVPSPREFRDEARERFVLRLVRANQLVGRRPVDQGKWRRSREDDVGDPVFGIDAFLMAEAVETEHPYADRGGVVMRLVKRNGQAEAGQQGVGVDRISGGDILAFAAVDRFADECLIDQDPDRKWMKLAGMYDENDPLVQQWIQCMADYRREVEEDPNIP